MYVAVGRVQVMVTMAERAGRRQTDEPASSRPNTVEKAYTREKLQRAVEADRARWDQTIGLCAPRRL